MGYCWDGWIDQLVTIEVINRRWQTVGQLLARLKVRSQEQLTTFLNRN